MDGSEEQRRQFAEYFNARRDAVRRVGYLLCGDWHLADDLTQTAFTKLAAGWARIRDAGALDAYVRTCLIRAYLSERRRAWRRRERGSPTPPETVSTEDSPGAVELRLAVTGALHRLPRHQVAILVCRYYLDMDVAATAAALNCAEGSVKSGTARGLARLRELLGASELDPRPGSSLVEKAEVWR
jgi:RNA polymerase sigma-70 factor (sigma-E family)